MSDAFEYKDMGLETLMRALKENDKFARVGILGDSHRKDSGSTTNAEIGMKHEYGVDGPIRSFLRMPLSTKLQKFLDEAGVTSEDAIKEIISTGSMEGWLKKVGVVGEACVAEAFATGGFGEWKPSNMARKKVQQTLVETQQLRNSITSDVE